MVDVRLRRFLFGAVVLGGLLGVLLGVVSSASVFGAVVGGVLGAAGGAIVVLYWGEHGGARRRRVRRVTHPRGIPQQRSVSR